MRAPRSICLSLKLLDVDCLCIDNPTVWGLVKTFLQATCCNGNSCCPEPGHRRFCLPCPGRKRGLEGDHLARELLSHQDELADEKKSYESTFACECRGTLTIRFWHFKWHFSPSGASGDKRLGFVACKHSGRGMRHHVGKKQNKWIY